jgi:5-hydroxyisourate hydrolase
MKKIRDFTLNDDGRCDTPILENDQFNIGKYEIKFFCGEYFRKFTKLNEIPFLDDVVIRFGISDNNQHYHVPLLISPWSYTTYRGS